MESSQKIKLTVIIPVYNRPERVVKALDSIPARNDIETIVVDECSTDNTLEVLKAYNRIPITILQNEVNSLQLENIKPISLTSEVSKLEKSNSVI